MYKLQYFDILLVILGFHLNVTLAATPGAVVVTVSLLGLIHYLYLLHCFHDSTKFSPMEKLGVLKSSFEQINQVCCILVQICDYFNTEED